MQMKPFAAFGHVLICNILNEGEVYTAIVEEGTPCTIFWAKGYYTNKHVSANAEFRDFPRGTFLRPSDLVPGVFEHTAVEASEVFCYDARLNAGRQPQIDPFILSAGEERVLPKGTKLFFCSGALAVAGRALDRPTQLTISTADTVVRADADCYGLLFS